MFLAELISSEHWRQVALPTTYGGLGLRAAAPRLHAVASYWCSAAAAASVIPQMAPRLGMHQPAEMPVAAQAEEAHRTLLKEGVQVNWSRGVAGLN